MVQPNNRPSWFCIAVTSTAIAVGDITHHRAGIAADFLVASVIHLLLLTARHLMRFLDRRQHTVGQRW